MWVRQRLPSCGKSGKENCTDSRWVLEWRFFIMVLLLRFSIMTWKWLFPIVIFTLINNLSNKISSQIQTFSCWKFLTFFSVYFSVQPLYTSQMQPAHRDEERWRWRSDSIGRSRVRICRTQRKSGLWIVISYSLKRSSLWLVLLHNMRRDLFSSLKYVHEM